MRRKELFRQGKRTFAAILAAAVTLTSVAPGTMVYAQEELLIEEEPGGGISGAGQDAAGTPELYSAENGAGSGINMESGDSFGGAGADNNSDGAILEEGTGNPDGNQSGDAAENDGAMSADDAINGGTGADGIQNPGNDDINPQDDPNAGNLALQQVDGFVLNIEEVEEPDGLAVSNLQSRIDALPTPEEFWALADDSDAEGGAFTEQQLEIYEEAQAIADEYEALSEEEQAQLDISRLETLMNAINAATAVTAAAGTDITLGGGKCVEITEPGTYNIRGVNDQTPMKDYALKVAAGSGDITLNIQGDISLCSSMPLIHLTGIGDTTANGLIEEKDIEATHITIKGNGHTIENTGACASGGTDASEETAGTVVMKSAKFKVAYNGTWEVMTRNPSVTLESGTYKASDGAEYNIENIDGHLIIKDTTIIGGSCGIRNSSVYDMYNGTIQDVRGRGIWNDGRCCIYSGTIQRCGIGGKDGVDGGGIYNKRNLSIYSANIIDNQARQGGGIYNRSGVSKMNLLQDPKYGNEITITGNRAYGIGGGVVSVESSGWNDLKGKIEISGNTSETSASHNLAINVGEGMSRLIDVQGALTGSNIYFTLGEWNDTKTAWKECTGIVTSDYSTMNPGVPFTTYFHLDTKTKSLNQLTACWNENKTEMGVYKHQHRWSYKAIEDVGQLYAYCTGSMGQASCPYYGTTDDYRTEINLTLRAKDRTYNGKQYTGLSVDDNISAIVGKKLKILYKKGKTGDYTEEVPINAGSYEVTAVIGDVGESYEGLEEKKSKISQSFKISKMSVPYHAPKAIENLVYDGKAQKLVTEGSVTGGKVVYRYRFGEESALSAVQEEVPTGKDAGSYTVWGITRMDENHTTDTTSVKRTVTIAPKSLTDAMVSLDFTEKEYNGTVFAPKVTVSDTAAAITENDYTITGATEASDVGTYVITIEGKGNYTGKIEKEWKISPKELTVTWKDTVLTYTGSPQKPTASLNGVEDVDNGKVSASVTGERTDAGTDYQAKVTIDNPNYKIKAGNETTTFTIKRAGASAAETAITNVKSLSKTYDGAAIDAVQTTSKNTSNPRIEYKKKDEPDTAYGTEAPQDAGDYTVKVTYPQDKNYEAAFAAADFTISPKEITLQWSDTELTYNGADQKPTATVANGSLCGADTCTVTVSGEKKDAGTYTATATDLDNPNYKLPANPVTEFTIAPKEVELQWSNMELTYSGEEQKPAATVVNSSLYGGDTCEVTVFGGQINAGDYTATASIDNANYTIQTGGETTTFTIKRAAASASGTVIINVDSLSKNYDGNLADTIQSTSENTSKPRIEYKKKGEPDESYTPEAPKDAGDYVVRVTYPQDANHEESSATAEFTIARKPITVIANDAKKDSGKADPKLTYRAAGLAAGETLTGITVRRKVGEAVGSYAITATQANGANPNYAITFQNGTFTIEPADQSRLSGKAIYNLKKLPMFLAKGTGGNKKVTLFWKKYAGADGYEVYWSYCDSKQNFKKLTTVGKRTDSATHKKLKNNRAYKYFVAAYKMANGKKVYIARSNALHVAMKKAKTTNAKSIKVNKTKVVLKAKKTFRLKCKTTLVSKGKKQLLHTDKYRYLTTNSRIATVSKSGIITAKAKGACDIYIFANNGVYKKVKVTVK